MRHRTARGDLIDMAALATQNADQVALGNARMNARGDILGDHGIVLKTQEQIEAEWAAEKAKLNNTGNQSEDIKAPLDQMIASPSAKKQPHLMVDKDFDMDMISENPGTENVSPKAQTNKTPRRRIVETE